MIANFFLGSSAMLAASFVAALKVDHRLDGPVLQLFSVRFQGKWTDTWKQVDVGPKYPEPEGDTETGSGTFTSTLDPGRTLLAIGPDSPRRVRARRIPR